jgi:hypothetical protein
MKMYGGVEVWVHAFLISALDGGEWSASRFGRFTLTDRVPSIHWISDWCRPQGRSGCGGDKKNLCPCWESNPDYLARSDY